MRQTVRNFDLSALGDALAGAVRTIATDVRAAGGRAMMVGGAVRDLCLGSSAVKDVDIEVFGLAPEMLQRVLSRHYAFDPCGVSFGVLKLHGVDVDVSLPRRESKRGIGHRGFMIDADPGLTVAEAAERRDFTLNALYYDPLGGVLEDPYGGLDDLDRRILRHVSAKFTEDPLRVLRGMQFVARFGLEPAPETIAVCRTMTIEDLPCERLFEEWAKLLVKGRHVARGLDFLRRTGWVRYTPELQALIGCTQDPKWHPEGDVWNHTSLALDAFAGKRIGDAHEDLVVGLAVLCHDFGKPACTKFSNGHWRSPGHDEAGVAPTLSFLRRLTNEERILRDVPQLVKCHMQPFSLWKSKAGDAAIRRLAVRVGRIDRLVRVAEADDAGRLFIEPSQARPQELAWLVARAEALRVADAMPKPILMGRHLVEMGYRPSPQFHAWLQACFEAQLDGLFGDLPGARAYFREHFAVH